MFSLGGKKVVIIGGSYGMGFAASELAIDAGAEVAIAARNADKLAEAARKLEGRGGRAVPWRSLHVEDRQAVADFLSECAPFDHLVLPGSTVKPIRYQDLTSENARESFESKFWGPFWAAFDARPHIRRGGSVVFFTGVAAKRPVSGYVVGACINGALNAGVRSLALEFAQDGVRINAIAPGASDTPLMDILHADDKEELFASLSRRLPVRRIGRAQDCAMGVIYLLTNGYVTAQVLGIDGGQEVMD